MAGSRNPFSVLFTMTLIGTLLGVMARFAYGAYVIVQAGESLRSVPPTALLFQVMGIHWFALYGAGVGAILGVALIIIDLLRPGADEQLTWRAREVIDPFAEDEVKARRMTAGDRYLKEKARDGSGESG